MRSISCVTVKVDSRFNVCCSMRWKTLLGFKCRNRLLLTGTPIQNTMAEVCSVGGCVLCLDYAVDV